jgi:hypothetical protein
VISILYILHFIALGPCMSTLSSTGCSFCIWFFQNPFFFNSQQTNYKNSQLTISHFAQSNSYSHTPSISQLNNPNSHLSSLHPLRCTWLVLRSYSKDIRSEGLWPQLVCCAPFLSIAQYFRILYISYPKIQMAIIAYPKVRMTIV